MPYTVRYSDTNKGIIVVEDETVNDETGLFLPGKRSVGYGQYVAENFLHLLENFANTTPPERPVEGQLWYDTTELDEQLKVYDGTNWVPAGGLKKGSNRPSINNSIRGDLWANTETQQLYIFTGAEWVLIGPEYSDGLLTGSKSENILGIDNLEYAVLFLKIQDKNVAIISDRNFVPKVSIPGFTEIKAGINITSLPLVNTNTVKYWGIAEKSEALQVTNDPTRGVAVISANNFLRKDIDAGKQSINVPIDIRNNSGITVGESSQIGLFVNGNDGVLQNNISGSSISIRMREGTNNRTVVYVDGLQRVGINNTAPEEDLDVKGNLYLRPKDGSTSEGKLRIDNTSEESFVTQGGASIAKNLELKENLSVAGSITHTGNVVGPENIGNSNNGLDIGLSTNRYNSVWATTFNGNLVGNVTGILSGNATTANRLVSNTSFTMTGDVTAQGFNFDGAGGTKEFQTTISDSFITSKTPITDTLSSDEILINRVDNVNGQKGVYKTTKQSFVKDIPTNPIGTLVQYAGDLAPAGWLLCDGSILNKSTYNDLWQVIGHKFLDPSFLPDNGTETFALPDFRGRMPMGVDNMGGTSANVVTDIEASTLGSQGGSETKTIEVENLPEHQHDMRGEDTDSQYYSVRVSGSSSLESGAVNLSLDSGTADGDVQGYTNSGGIRTSNDLNQPLSVMNPYVAINFIIYTGRI
jgi:microcystin-dependent protein/surface antigen